MKRICLLLGMLISTNAAAEGFGLEAKVSTLGLGAELHYGFSDYFNARLGLNNFTYDYNTTEDDIEYNFDLELKSTALLVDFHPFGGRFRLTGGILNNKNEFQGNAALANDYTIGGTTYTSEEVGTLTGRVFFEDDNVPYLGLGWASNPGDSGLSISFDIGVVLQGEPSASLTTQGGTLIDDPQFQDDLQQEEQALQDDMREFDTYPVASIGLQFRF